MLVISSALIFAAATTAPAAAKRTEPVQAPQVATASKSCAKATVGSRIPVRVCWTETYDSEHLAQAAADRTAIKLGSQRSFIRR